MNKTIVIDASVAAAFLIPQDSHHAAARKWFEAALAGEDRLTAPTLILLEVASAMTRVGMGEKPIDRALSFLREACDLTPSFELETESLLLVRTLRLRAMDSYYVALAKISQAELCSFDQTQIRAAAHTGVGTLDII